VAIKRGRMGDNHGRAPHYLSRSPSGKSTGQKKVNTTLRLTMGDIGEAVPGGHFPKWDADGLTNLQVKPWGGGGQMGGGKNLGQHSLLKKQGGPIRIYQKRGGGEKNKP